MQPSSILFLITKSNWGGAQRYVFDMATYLPKDRYRVSVALGGTGARDAHTGMLSHRLEERGIRTIRIRHFMRDMSLLRDIAAFFEVLSLLRHERPNIIHANSSKAGGIGMLAGVLASIPVRVFTVHGFAFNEPRGVLVTFLMHIASWLTLLCSTDVICVSRFDADIASRWPFVGKKIRHIPVGIAPFPLLTTQEARRALLPNHAWSGVWLGSIAELHPNKGLSNIIEACALLRDRDIDIHYCIIGAGQEEATLKQQIQRLKLSDRVLMLGHVFDAATFLAAFDIVVLPSVKEGFPYVILEAGYAARPVVASNIASIKSILTHKSTALLAQTKDPVSFAAMIEKLVINPELGTTLGIALKQHVSGHYTLKTMVEQTVPCYIPKNSLSASSRGTARA